MQAGEVGIRIRVDAVITLTGATTLDLVVCGPSDANPRLLAMTVDSPSNFAVRDTLATDFPDSGNYFVQLHAIFPDGRDLLSPAKLEHVGQSVVAEPC